MKRIAFVGLLALTALTAGASSTFAQYSCNAPGVGGGAPGGGNLNPFGCKGLCFRFLGAIHQHGPLYNYGPYAGYYPFEPYGPWNSNLQYTGPYPPSGACGWNSLCGNCGRCNTCTANRAGFGRSNQCSQSWGRYANTTLCNVRSRIFPLFHRQGKSSDSCGSGCASLASPAAVVALTNSTITAVSAEEPAALLQSPRSER